MDLLKLFGSGKLVNLDLKTTKNLLDVATEFYTDLESIVEEVTAEEKEDTK